MINLMHRTTHIAATLVVVCLVSKTLATRVASAEGPATEIITFGLRVPVTGADGIPTLSDALGEQTVGIYFGKDFGDEVASVMNFDPGSLPCGEHEVAGSDWALFNPAMIVNHGQPTYALVYATSGLDAPAENSFLHSAEILDVHACWLSVDGSGNFAVEEEFSAATGYAFYIVTAEVRSN